MAFRFLARVPAVAAAFAIVPLLALVLRRAVDLPFWDEWEWADLVYAAHLHTLTFAQLWAPHNEHRILVSNVFARERMAFIMPLGCVALGEIVTVVLRHRSAADLLHTIAVRHTLALVATTVSLGRGPAPEV